MKTSQILLPATIILSQHCNISSASKSLLRKRLLKSYYPLLLFYPNIAMYHLLVNLYSVKDKILLISIPPQQSLNVNLEILESSEVMRQMKIVSPMLFHLLMILVISVAVH